MNIRRKKFNSVASKAGLIRGRKSIMRMIVRDYKVKWSFYRNRKDYPINKQWQTFF